LTDGASGVQGARTTGAHARGAPRGSARDAELLARIVFGLLVVACLCAFFLTQRLKHSPTAVQSFKLTPRFSPTAAGHIKQERISFKLARADEVTVTVVSSTGATVATLVRDWPVARYKQLSLRWNGREGPPAGVTVSRRADGTTLVQPVNDSGPAPAGAYRVRVRLARQRRELLSPRSFTLVRGRRR
jgi:hypothetical protein